MATNTPRASGKALFVVIAEGEYRKARVAAKAEGVSVDDLIRRQQLETGDDAELVIIRVPRRVVDGPFRGSAALGMTPGDYAKRRILAPGEPGKSPASA
jgi:hypothetical protein